METSDFELCKVYAAMLGSTFMEVNDKSAVCYGLGSQAHVEIDGQGMYLPTEALLDSKKHENSYFFHPLCEDALHGQSKTIHFLTRRVLAALSLRVDTIVGNLLNLASDGSKQSKFKNAEAVKFLKVAKGVKDNSVKAWDRLVKQMSENTGLFSAYLNRNIEIDGTHYSRVCVLDVPALRDTLPGADLCGVNVLSKANKELFREIMVQIFDGVALEYGSNHTVPYLHALLTMYKEVSERLNHVVNLFKGAIPSPIVHFDWYDELFGENFDRYYGSIPPLAGNTGEDPRSSVAKVDRDRAGRDVENPPFDPDPKPARTPGALRLSDLDDRDDRDDRRSRRDRDDRDRGRRGRDDREDSFEAFNNSDRPRESRRDDDRDRGRGRRSRLRDAFDRDDRDDRRGRRDDRDDRDDRRGSRRGGISLDDLD